MSFFSFSLNFYFNSICFQSLGHVTTSCFQLYIIFFPKDVCCKWCSKYMCLLLHPEPFILANSCYIYSGWKPMPYWELIIPLSSKTAIRIYFLNTICCSTQSTWPPIFSLIWKSKYSFLYLSIFQLKAQSKFPFFFLKSVNLS